MESYVIVGMIILMVAIGLYLIWKAGEYLYEVGIEYFTSDPDPESPDIITESIVEGYITDIWWKLSKKYDKRWLNICEWGESQVKMIKSFLNDIALVPGPPKRNMKDNMSYVSDMRDEYIQKPSEWSSHDRDFWSSDMEKSTFSNSDTLDDTQCEIDYFVNNMAKKGYSQKHCDEYRRKLERRLGIVREKNPNTG